MTILLQAAYTLKLYVIYTTFGNCVLVGVGLHRPTSLRGFTIFKGVGTNFGVGVVEARPEGPRAGVGFLGRGSQPLSTS